MRCLVTLLFALVGCAESTEIPSETTSSPVVEGHWSLQPPSACQFDAVAAIVLAGCAAQVDADHQALIVNNGTQFEAPAAAVGSLWLEVVEEGSGKGGRVGLRAEGTPLPPLNCSSHFQTSFRLASPGLYKVALCAPASGSTVCPLPIATCRLAAFCSSLPSLDVISFLLLQSLWGEGDVHSFFCGRRID